jgi:hypothetical protein
MATWRDVSRIALALPGASEEARSGGLRAWIVNKHFFVWERPLRGSDLKALGDAAPDGPILGVRPVFFTTPHFNGYPAVLVRLGAIKAARLKGVMVEAWLARAAKRAVAEYLASTRKA